jgi:hypothetical protein
MHNSEAEFGSFILGFVGGISATCLLAAFGGWTYSDGQLSVQQEACERDYGEWIQTSEPGPRGKFEFQWK